MSVVNNNERKETMKKQDMKKCSFCKKYTTRCTESKICARGVFGDHPDAKDLFEPRLLTMGMAIFEAVSMGGGEVWKEGESEHELTVTASFDIDFYQEQYHTSDGKCYTVRPLPDPYPLSFAEAWEALGRGESVEYMKNGHLHNLGSSIYVRVDDLKGEQFRIVENNGWKE